MLLFANAEMTSIRKNSSKDFIEYVASFGNLHEVIDVHSSSDESDDIQIIKELKTSKNLDHRCDLCCEGEFLIDRALRFGGLINDKYRFVCDKCDKNFVHQSELTKHSSNCSGPSFDEKRIINGCITTVEKQHTNTCSVCLRSYKSPGGLKRHVITKHGELIRKCAVCQKKFSDFAKFKYHCYLHQKAKKYQYTCSLCNKGFISANNFQKHQKTHQKE